MVSPNPRSSALAVDGSGNFFITGSFVVSADFGGTTLTSAGSAHAYLAKFDASGAHLWSTVVQSQASFNAGYDSGWQLVRGVIVVGGISGPVDFGGGFISTNGRDGFAASYSDAGALQWVQLFGGSYTGTQHDVIAGVATDAAGDIAVAGAFGQTMTLGTRTFVALGEADLLVAKLSSGGAVDWVKPRARSEATS